jgi:transcriptional regulator EpsA
MIDLPLLSPTNAEVMIRLIETSVAVRHRPQFFAWAQSGLQSLLPHQVLVCGAYLRETRTLDFDVFNSVVVAPEAMALLANPQSDLWCGLIRCWVDGGGKPVQVESSDLTAVIDEGEARQLLSTGLTSLLVHGVARPQRADELETMFLFASTTPQLTSRSRLLAEMLLPHLHSTWLRMKAGPIQPEPVTPLRRDDARALITEREAQILSGVREGKTNQQIGAELGISALTVKNHVQKILRKLGAANRAQAVAMTMRPQLPGQRSVGASS